MASVAYDKGKLPRPKFFVDPGLDKEVRALLKQRPNKRVDSWFHPHTFGKWCRRREVLRILAQGLDLELERKRPAPTTGLIFEAGHGVHRHVRNVLLAHKLRGCWKCGKCGSPHGYHIHKDEDGWEEMVVDELVFRPEKCRNCGYTEKESFRQGYEVFMEFIEPPIIIDGYRIKGHTDGLLVHLEKNMICELKSQDPKLWTDRRGPDIGHMLQGTCYAWGLKETYDVDVDLAATIYVNKSTYRMKTYIFKTDSGKIDWIKDEIEAVRTIVDANKERIHSEEDLRVLRAEAEFNSHCNRECAHENVSQAKGCPLRAICFNLKSKTRRRK